MNISKSDRAELIRKKNRSFNRGDIEKASKIFETVKYIDGLIRVGDYYHGKNELLNSLIYYKKIKGILKKNRCYLRSPNYN